MTDVAAPMATFLAFDMETGGITTDYSLLTAYFVVLDQYFNPIEELDLVMRPANGKYLVNAGALRINGIDLVAHDDIAINYETAATRLYSFLSTHSNMGSRKLVPIGHNVFFDEEFEQAWLVKKGNWQKFVSYRRLDTQVIAQYLMLKGTIAGISGSLASLANHFGIENPGAHTSKGDTLTTIEVLKRMVRC